MKVVIIDHNFSEYFSELREFSRKARVDIIFDIEVKKKWLCDTTQSLTDFNWASLPNSLLYQVYIKKTFEAPDGALMLLYINNELASVSGVSKSEWNPNVALATQHFFVLRKFRGRVFQKLLPAQKEWAKAHGFKKMIIGAHGQDPRISNIMKRACKRQTKAGEELEYKKGSLEKYGYDVFMYRFDKDYIDTEHTAELTKYLENRVG